jgi:GTP cyclohydrolase II
MSQANHCFIEAKRPTRTRRRTRLRPLHCVVSTRIPTKWGAFQLLRFEREASDYARGTEIALAMILGDLTQVAPLICVCSQSSTGAVHGSPWNDCNEQLEVAMRTIAAEGRGIVIYELDEGRGSELMGKSRAYALQDTGVYAIGNNRELELAGDCRDFTFSVAILRKLGVPRVCLLSNNPQESRALARAGINVVARISCKTATNPHSVAYPHANPKAGHALSLDHGDSVAHANDARADRPGFASVEDAIRELGAWGLTDESWGGERVTSRSTANRSSANA